MSCATPCVFSAAALCAAAECHSVYVTTCAHWSNLCTYRLSNLTRAALLHELFLMTRKRANDALGNWETMCFSHVTFSMNYDTDSGLAVQMIQNEADIVPSRKT